MDRSYFVKAQLSERMVQLHGGDLLCKDVPIARAGQLLYRPHQLLGKNGKPKVRPRPGENVVVITRDAAELGSAKTIASFEGRPVTLAHAGGWVTPENYREVSMGRTENVRMGDGEDADKLMADLVITDREAIQAILERRLREVSIGYEAEYQELAPGFGRQFNIVGNHTSVLKSGRCGSEVAIFDAAMQPNPEDSDMNLTQRLAATLARLTGQNPDAMTRVVDEAMADAATEATRTTDAAVKKAEAAQLRADLEALSIRVTDADKAVADAEAAEAAAAAEAAKTTDAGEQPAPAAPTPAAPVQGAQAQPNQGGDPVLAAVQQMNAKLDQAIDAMLKLLKIEGGEAAPAEGAATETPAPPTTDAAADADGTPTFDAETIARAEILFPGVPRTPDMKAVALAHAMTSPDGKGVVDLLLCGKTFDSADQDTLFAGAAELLRAKRVQNLGSESARALDAKSVARANGAGAAGRAGKETSSDDVNAVHREHYKAA